MCLCLRLAINENFDGFLHDWSIEGEYSQSNPMGDRCGYLSAGTGWYRKTIDVDPAGQGKHVEIVFDGACMSSTVWANGKELGNRR